jgi:hypothetical protein
MLTSFLVACQHEGCDWTGSLIPLVLVLRALSAIRCGLLATNNQG